MAMIRVGVAGWDYPDWAGIVYPSPLPVGFDRLAFLGGFFDAVEINVTFYRQVDPKTSRSWVSRAPSGSSFMFTAKLHQAFTHARRRSTAFRMSPGAAPTTSQSKPTEKTADLDLRAEARTYLAGI